MLRRVWSILLVTLVSAAPVAAVADSHDAQREGGLTGTGIVGTITHLGSFHVNGQRVVYDEGFELGSAFGTVAADSLLPGHTIAVEVATDGSDWRAISGHQIFPVIGPVGEVDQDGFTVLGSRVVFDGNAVTSIPVGQWVAVSGLWRGDQIVASRVTLIAPQPQARLVGTYFEPQDGDALRVGGSLVQGIVPEHAEDGDVIQVSGDPLVAGLAAQELRLGIFDHNVGLVLAQGYMSLPRQSGLYSILGSGLAAFTSSPAMIDEAQVGVFCGVDGEISGPMPRVRALADAYERLGCGE